jgi:hyaluronate lyase
LVNVDRNRKGEHKASDISVDGRRSVFFLGDAIVHLGAGYDVRDAERDTYSSLEQRQSIRPDGGAEAVYAAAGGMKRLAAGETLKAAGVKWVLYDGVAYLPPADGHTVVQDVMQPGTPGRQVFSVYSDHGREDASLAFEYAVVPGISAEAIEKFAASRPWVVVANTTAVQAVWVPQKQWLAAVFHEAGEVQTPLGTVRVDRPSAVVVSLDAAGRMTLQAADALDTAGTLHVRVGDVSADLELPAGDCTGAIAKVTFAKTDGLWKAVD